MFKQLSKCSGGVSHRAGTSGLRSQSLDCSANDGDAKFECLEDRHRIALPRCGREVDIAASGFLHCDVLV